MSTTWAGGHAADAVRRPTVSGEAGRGRWVAWLAGIVLLAAACGGGSAGPAASPGQALYQQELTYSRCMRSHGVPDFPILKQGPGGSLIHPLSPPAGMLTVVAG